MGAFFLIITCRALCRGNFHTVADLSAAIRRFIDGWDDRCTRSRGPRDPTSSSPGPLIHGDARSEPRQLQSTRVSLQPRSTVDLGRLGQLVS